MRQEPFRISRAAVVTALVIVAVFIGGGVTGAWLVWQHSAGQADAGVHDLSGGEAPGFGRESERRLDAGSGQRRVGSGASRTAQTRPAEIEGLLQTLIERDTTTADRRAGDMRVLSQYGWVDRQSGIVHIPIERAMELVARGQR